MFYRKDGRSDGQGMAERGFVFVSLKLVHLVLSSQVCFMIISVHAESAGVPPCGCWSSLLGRQIPRGAVPLAERGTENGSHFLKLKRLSLMSNSTENLTK